ncbi:hypothetical protein NQ318_019819 [Aromia moschata]|uniref:Uncharacterized protein n=1 Tax=Aromia moschata TaxID=1265417 RepID=A0AAV8YKV2_9CUCU|nr:hypothetical protein NQ318_019819 [Aromia moschata]
MRFLIVFLLVTVFQYKVEPYSTIRQIIDEFLRVVRDTLPDTVSLPDRELEGPENVFIGSSATAYNNSITGLKYFTADIEYSGILVPVPRRAKLTYDQLELHSDYISRIVLKLLPSLGYENQGTLDAITRGSSWSGTVEFTTIPLSLRVADLDLHIDDIEVEVQGLLGSRLLSRWASSILTQYGADIVNRSADVLAPILTDVINRYIERYFPFSANEEYENGIEIKYTKEELDAAAGKLKAGLDNMLNDLKTYSHGL